MKSELQGTADGLCGLYALVNFMVRFKQTQVDGERTEAETAFYLLTEEAERRHLLTAHKVALGYNDPDLVEIFNGVAERFRMPFRAILLSPFDEQSRLNSAVYIGSVIDIGGVVIAGVDGSNHWVLLFDQTNDGRFSALDAARGDARKTIRASDVSEALAILPIESRLLKENNA